MSVLVDTNLLLRRLDPGHSQHRVAVEVTERLIASGEPVHVTPQNVAEFWATATRPVDRNGLGLDVEREAAAIERIERTFALLPDDPNIHEYWKHLVVTHRIVGNRVYDARLVAAMLVHRIGRILTFNTGDFAGYGVEVLHPAAV